MTDLYAHIPICLQDKYILTSMTILYAHIPICLQDKYILTSMTSLYAHIPICLQDKYILTSMTILCLVCVWHSIVPLILGHPGDVADRAALAILGSLYVFFHAFFFIWIFCSVTSYYI